MSKEEYEKTMSIHTVSEKLREAEEQIELGEVTDAKAPLSKLREKYGVNSNQYYCLLLDECACPAFCSSEKPYFGTQKDLRKIAKQMKNLGVYEDTVAALDAYFHGDHEAHHYIAYRDVPVLTPVEVVEIHEHKLDKSTWTHTNIWGFPYMLKIDRAEISTTVFRLEEDYLVGIKVCLTNLAYENLNQQWYPLNGGFWGNSCVFDISNSTEDEDFTVNTLPYFALRRFSNKKEAIKKSKTQPTVEDLKVVCDDIFADG